MRVSLRRSLGLLARPTSQKPLLFPIVFSVVVAAGVASVVFCALPTDECAGWFSTLLATLVGVVLAARISMWLFQVQREQNEERRKQQLRDALIAELQATIDRLNTETREIVRAPAGSHQPDVKVVLTHLEPIACDEAIKSALFGHKNTVNLTHLAREMRDYTKAADILRELLVSPRTDAADPADPYPPHTYQVARNVYGSERYVDEWCKTVLKGFEDQGIEIPPEDKLYTDPSKEASLEDLTRQSQPMQNNE